MHAHHEPSGSPSTQNRPSARQSLRSFPLTAPIPRAGQEQDPTTVVLLGYTGARTAREVLLDGLSTRGRSKGDHTGLAVHTPAGLRLVSHPGPPADLRQTLTGHPGGSCGIAATSAPRTGPPQDRAPQPHVDCTARVTVVCAGVLENQAQLRAGLQAAGHVFGSQDDAEVLAHLIEHELDAAFGHLHRALLRALPRLHGRFALLSTGTDHPDTIVAAQRGVPLVAARAGAETVISSLSWAIETVLSHRGHHRQTTVLGEDQTAELRAGRIHIRSTLTFPEDEQ